MRVLLLKTLSATAGPDIGLGYLATALRRAGHEVEVGDLELDETRGVGRTVTERVRDFDPDWVGVKVFDHSVGRSRNYLAEARAVKPSIHTTAGGPHVSGFAERALESLPEADHLIAGEAERALPALMEAVATGGSLQAVPGLIRRTEHGPVVNPRDFPDDLDGIGLPAWDLLYPREHIALQKREPWLDRPVPYVPVVTTRGCPYPCTFCAAPVNTGKKLRHHSVEWVVDEIAHLKERYGIETFSIADDAFTNDRRYVESFCRELIRRDLNVRWDASSNGIRCDTVDAEPARLLERSGCERVSFGIETGSDEILLKMGKRFSLAQVERAIEIIRAETRIRMEGFIIIGYPDETYRDAWKTLRMLSRIDLDTVWLFGFSPHVGTAVAEQLAAQGEDEIRWEDFGNDRIMQGTRHMPKAAVQVYFALAWMLFYLRPSRTWRYLRWVGPAAFVQAFRRLAHRFRMVLFPSARPTPLSQPAHAHRPA